MARVALDQHIITVISGLTNEILLATPLVHVCVCVCVCVRVCVHGCTRVCVCNVHKAKVIKFPVLRFTTMWAGGYFPII